MEFGAPGGMRRSASHNSLSGSDDFDLTHLLNKPRINVERQRSFDDRSLSDVSYSGHARGGAGGGGFDGMYSPGGGLRSLVGTPASSALHSFEPHPIVGDAWEALRRSLVFFRGQPLGTIAAYDHASEEVLNYDQVFVRDFVPSAMAFLMNGEPEIVKNFLLKTVLLQGWEKKVDRFKLGEGAMPAHTHYAPAHRTAPHRNPNPPQTMATPATEPEPEVFDVVIFGASGFTGKYVIREALKFLPPNASPLRTLALAGRSRDRVAAALRWAAAPGPAPDVPILVADASDPASLAALASRARVLLSCAGPFRLYGHQVAAACAEAGADCLDISGEPEFMERVEADLHEVAARNGSLIVSACGFDSIPAELGFFFNSRQWDPPSAPVSIVAHLSLESHKKIVGNFATFESAVLGFASASKLQALRRSRPRLAKPRIPGPPPPTGPLIKHDKALGLWVMKLPSADTVVVKRTLSKVTQHPEGLPGVEETPDFAERRQEFWSSVKPAHFGVKIGTRSILGVIPMICTGLFIGILGGFSFGRSLLLKFPALFSMGWFRKSGPTEAEVSSASFKMWFVGHGYGDSTRAAGRGGKPDKEIVTRVSGPEIGYITTPIVLIQSALVLLSQRGNLPKGGVYTPGAVFGPTDLQKRLEENGLSFDVISRRTLP